MSVLGQCSLRQVFSILTNRKPELHVICICGTTIVQPTQKLIRSFYFAPRKCHGLPVCNHYTPDNQPAVECCNSSPVVVARDFRCPGWDCREVEAVSLESNISCESPVQDSGRILHTSPATIRPAISCPIFCDTVCRVAPLHMTNTPTKMQVRRLIASPQTNEKTAPAKQPIS